MKKKQAWKVMGAVLAGTLVFSDAVPLRASASAGTEKSAVQNETVSGTENGTETKTKRAAVYVNLKTGDDTADGTTAETAVKTVEKAQELLAAAAAELQADGKTTEKNTTADTSKTAAEEAAEKYLVFVGMDENGTARHAHLRSTASQGKGFRQTAEGSDARYSFHFAGGGKALYVFESPIDLLSYITLHMDDWQAQNYVACCGTAFAPVEQMLRTHPQIRQVYLCLDNDEAGHSAFESFSAVWLLGANPPKIVS